QPGAGHDRRQIEKGRSSEEGTRGADAERGPGETTGVAGRWTLKGPACGAGTGTGVVSAQRRDHTRLEGDRADKASCRGMEDVSGRFDRRGSGETRSALAGERNRPSLRPEPGCRAEGHNAERQLQDSRGGL